MNSIELLKAGEYTGKLQLKVVRIEVKGDHRILTVYDRNKTFTTLAFWQPELYIVEQMEANKLYKFDKLKTKGKWAPAGQPAPPGVQLVFDAQHSSIDGIEVKRPETANKEISILGAEVCIDGQPVVQTMNEVMMKPGQVKMVETNLSLIEKHPKNYALFFQPLIETYEAGLLVLNVPLPNETGRICLPMMSVAKTACKVPKNCKIALLTVRSVSRIKLANIESGNDSFDEEDDGEKFDSDNDDSQQNELKKKSDKKEAEEKLQKLIADDDDEEDEVQEIHSSDDDQKRALKTVVVNPSSQQQQQRQTTAKKEPRKELKKRQQAGEASATFATKKAKTS